MGLHEALPLAVRSYSSLSRFLRASSAGAGVSRENEPVFSVLDATYFFALLSPAEMGSPSAFT